MVRLMGGRTLRLVLQTLATTPVLSVSGVQVGLASKAADTLADSAASITANLGTVKVGTLATVDLTSLLNQATSAVQGLVATAELATDVHLFSRPQTVRTAGRSVTFDPAETASLTVPLRQQGGVCRVVFTVSPTAVPGKGDARVLGVHFLGFRYTAP